MKSSEIKALYEQHNPSGHFFSRSNMNFMGDTMANFGVSEYSEKYWILYRKRPTPKTKTYTGSGWLVNKKTFTITPA